MYVLNALASVWKSPRTSDGAAFAYAWKSFASLEIRVSAFPDVVWSDWASFVPRASSCAQFFDVANFGAAELVVVEPAEVELDGGDADFLRDPPQPSAITPQTTADAVKCSNPTARASLARTRPTAPVASRHDRLPAREARRADPRGARPRRGRRRLPGPRDPACARARRRRRRDHAADLSRGPGGRAPAVRVRRRRRARALRPPPRGQRNRTEGRARGRLGLTGAGAPARDCARRRRALPGHPGHRQEDRRADRPRAQGAACRRGRADLGRRRDATAPRRPRRARRARLQRRRGRAGARRGRPRPAAGGARPAGVASRVSAPVQFLAPAARPDEEELEQSLRPRRLDDFVGQERIKEQLAVALEATRAREEALDHVLLVGPPGLGKTSLAYILREELGVGIRTVAGPALERKGDIAAILTALEARDVLFVDEIHRLNRSVEEILYPALEDFRLDIVVGQGPSARTLTLDLPPFTLVGATTRTGLLTTPLRDRFGMTFRLGYYEVAQLALIVRRSAGILGVQVAADAAEEIAARARGTPPVANRILRRVRDVAEVRHQGAITLEIALEALDLHEVDAIGLERADRELLEAIAVKFGGGPVGLSTLAVALGEEQETIEDVYEPYLLQLGFIQRTPRGRVITDLGRAHVGAPTADESLF